MDATTSPAEGHPRPRRPLPKRAFALSALFLGLPAGAGSARIPTSLPDSAIPRTREAAAIRGEANTETARVASRRRSASNLDPHIAAASLAHGVSHDLIRAIIETESQFDPFAVSSRGACGLMQLMPGTARRFGLVDCFDARQNIQAGTRYLKLLLTRYDGSVSLSIAAYNAGEGAVARHRGIPPYPQTRAYVRKVEALLAALSDVRSGMAAVTT